MNKEIQKFRFYAHDMSNGGMQNMHVIDFTGTDKEEAIDRFSRVYPTYKVREVLSTEEVKERAAKFKKIEEEQGGVVTVNLPPEMS